MPKARPLSDDELLAAISAAEETALGTLQGAISSDRADAIDRYYGKQYPGDAELQAQGRSTIISRDVADVVEGVVANVVKPFVGGDQVVVFDPIGPDDEKQAEQETDYVNFIALQRNNGFTWLVSAIKDALLLRTGYVKGNWTVRQDIITEQYQGLSDEEVGLMLKGKEVELVQHTEYPDPYYVAPPPGAQVMGQEQPPPMLHDVKVKRTRPTEYVSVDPVPPDEILVSERATGPSLQDVDFVQHRCRKTLSELREAGYDVEDDISDDDRGETIEDFSRQRFNTSNDLYDDNTGNMARRVVMYKESYIRIDKNGDGIAELRRVCSVGLNLLADDDCDIIPIASFSGVLVAHQHLGLSVYDLVEDIAKVKTNLMRSYLDNRNQINNSRTAVDQSRANVDDFLVSRPGGVVRGIGNPNEWLMPIVTPDTSSGALQGLEYLDTVRENRTGYTRNSAGMDNDALTNTTATGMSIQLSQSQLRLEMIARTIAETGVRDTFKIIHALTLKHSSRADKVQLNGEWVEVNPREWARRSDLSISIGLGTGTSDQQLGKAMAMGPVMQQMQMLGLVGVEEGYNYGSELWKLSGWKNTQKFIHAPQPGPPGPDGKPTPPQAPPPPPPPQVQVAQIQAQGDDKKLQATTQADVQKHQATQQADAQKFGLQAQLDERKLQMEAQAKHQEQQNALQVQASNDQRDNEKAALEHQRELQRMAMEDAFKRDQMMLQAQLKREEMQIQATTARETADGGEGMKGMAAQVKEMHANSNSPAEFQRGPDGRLAGVKRGNKTFKINRGPDGSAIGMQ